MSESYPIRHVIYRDGLTSATSPDIVRHAIRGVAYNGPRILMVFSPVNGDYKFPGGGIESGETHAQTLEREIMEECGLQVRGVGPKLAEIAEYGPAMEPEAEVFQMVSHYYLCRVDPDGTHARKLDDYEAELQFVPTWPTVEEALRSNRKLVAGQRPTPRWTPRETWFLETLLRMDLREP